MAVDIVAGGRRLEREREVADRAKAGFVRHRAIVDDGDGETRACAALPCREVRVKAPVRDDDAVGYASARLDLAQDARHHRDTRDLEERLRLVLRERVEPGREAGREEHGAQARLWRGDRRRERRVPERLAGRLDLRAVRLVAACVEHSSA